MNPLVLNVVVLFVGLLVGALLGIVACRKAFARSEERVWQRADRQQAELRTELDEVRFQLTDAQRAEAEARAEAAATERRLVQLSADRAALADQFQALAAQALARNNDQFLSVADQRLRRTEQAHLLELSSRQEAVTSLVAPLHEALNHVRTELASANAARAESAAALSTQVDLMRQTAQDLHNRTADLVTALRAPQVRGQWGEMQLRRVVEAAGMLNRVDFVEQEVVADARDTENTRGEKATLRPDMVIHLTDQRSIVVDSKVPFSGYLEATEASDADVQNDRLRAHARHMRAHIESLARKKYWEAVPASPEFVVMFVPAEAFLDAALKVDPSLVDFGFDQNVVLATPTTLLTLLRTVAYTWRTDTLAHNAEEVHRVGKELYTRLATVGTHMSTVGKRLDSAVHAYNQTVASLESRVFVSARRLAELEVIGTELPAPDQIERTTRALQAPEFDNPAMDGRIPDQHRPDDLTPRPLKPAETTHTTAAAGHGQTDEPSATNADAPNPTPPQPDPDAVPVAERT